MDTNKKNVTLDDLAAAMQVGFKQANDNHESLARMVSEGFNGVNDRFDKVESRLDKVESRLDKVEGRLDKLETSVEALRSSVNNYLELSDKRYLELKARQNVIANWVKTIAEKTGVKINLEDLEKAA